MSNKLQEEAVISLLILLSISDNELHSKEREFIEKLISEKNFSTDIDKELDQIHNKFRDDFDTASIYFINTIQDIELQKIVEEGLYYTCNHLLVKFSVIFCSHISYMG